MRRVIRSHSVTGSQRQVEALKSLMQAHYGDDWRQANRVGASAAGIIHGLTKPKDRALMLHLALKDRLTLPSRRYLLALKVCLKLSYQATWEALTLALHAQPHEGAEKLQAMLTERLEELLEALTAPLAVKRVQDAKPPPLRPLQARPAVRPGAPFHF